jgi:hypothetical protein
MKILSISAIILAFGLAPVNAGMVSSEELDQRGQCGLKSARMIVEGSESVVFPDDVKQCGELDGGSGNDSKVEAIPAPANDAADKERKIDLANLPAARSIPSPR